MPLVMDRDRIPGHWAAKKYLRPVESLGTSGASADCLRVALIINMPDPALEDTEAQFFELLDTAAIKTPLAALEQLLLRSQRSSQSPV